MMRRVTIGTVVGLALLLLPAAGSAAGATTVVQAIKAQDRIVKHNPEYTALKHLKVKTIAEAKAAIPKLTQLERVLDTAASTVAKATATAGQKAGRADWVTGAREDAKGIGELSIALRDLVRGNQTAADKAVAASEKLVKAANTIGDRGDRLLGLPTTD